MDSLPTVREGSTTSNDTSSTQTLPPTYVVPQPVLKANVSDLEAPIAHSFETNEHHNKRVANNLVSIAGVLMIMLGFIAIAQAHLLTDQFKQGPAAAHKALRVIAYAALVLNVGAIGNFALSIIVITMNLGPTWPNNPNPSTPPNLSRKKKYKVMYRITCYYDYALLSFVLGMLLFSVQIVTMSFLNEEFNVAGWVTLGLVLLAILPYGHHCVVQSTDVVTFR